MCVCVYVCVCVFIFVHECVGVCMWGCLGVCVCVPLCVGVGVCVCVYESEAKFDWPPNFGDSGHWNTIYRSTEVIPDLTEGK